MNDDDLFDLFDFGPDVADFALPPIAGGAPDSPWEWAWDRIQDIIGAGYDILEAIGRIAADIVQGVWEWVGGAVRFVYDWLSRFSEWLGTGLSNIWGDVRSYAWSAAYWVRDRLWDAANWVKGQVDNAANFIGQALINTANWIKDRVWDVGNWVKDRAWDAALWVAQRAWDVGHWVTDEAWKMATWAGGRISEAATWTVNSLLPPIMGGFGDIGDAFRGAFDQIGTALREALDAVADKIGDAIKWPWEHIWEPFVELLEHKLQIPARLIDGQYGSLRDVLDDLVDPPQAAFLGSAGEQIFSTVIGFTTAMVLASLLQPLMVEPTQRMTALVGRELLTAGEVQEAINRGFIDEATGADHLSRHGYSGPAHQALLDLRARHPSSADLMRMADKRVWNLEVPEKYGQYAELPDQVVKFMEQLGYEQDWTRNFWRAHWDLPSPQQVFEMLHRRVIEDADIEQYLGLTDWLPFFRDKLLAISYNPITRVDLRRLYKLKIITEQQVKDGYMDLGYNDEKAGWLTEFTKQYANPDDASQLDDMADLAASTFRTAYRRGVITRDDALDRIVDAGYTEDVADFYLSLDDAQMALNPTTDAGVPIRDLTVPIIRDAYSEKLWTRERAQTELEALGYLSWEADLLLQLEDLAQQRELTGLQETVIKELYLANSIDRAEAGHQLDTLGVLTERRDLLLQRWDLSRDTKDCRLTLAQLQTGFRDGLMSDTELLDELVAMGYNDKDAKFLVDITDKEPASQERRLSASQLQRAYKGGLISDTQLLDQLLALGYSQEDAALLVDMATPEPAAKERQLSGAQLAAGFRAGLLTDAELVEKLTAAGYAQADAELLRDIALPHVDTEARRLSVAQLKQAYKAELLDESGLLVELLALGYTDRDAGWLQSIIAPAETTE